MKVLSENSAVATPRAADDDGRVLVTLRVNGAEHRVRVRPHHTLLEVLRDELKLIGTREGCGIGMCGACTVHIDGQATRSCTMPMSRAANKAITTIEGLSEKGDHPVQVAWREIQVPQCGYCQSGQIMQAASLLKQKPKPTDAEIDTAMQGNICRCGTYARIRLAIRKAAEVKA